MWDFKAPPQVQPQMHVESSLGSISFQIKLMGNITQNTPPHIQPQKHVELTGEYNHPKLINVKYHPNGG